MTQRGMVIVAVAAAVVAGGAAYLVRGLAPSQTAIEEGNAYTVLHNKMMSAMAGPAVVYSGNADADFAMLMIPHHQGAIDMAKVEAKYGQVAAIRGLAQRIAGSQQGEIDQMAAWRRTHAEIAPTADPTIQKAAYAAANDRMMNGMMGGSMAHSGDADLDFVTLMIPHHQGAIDMANVELKYGRDEELRALAEKTLAAQSAEIADMKGWLKATGH
jgi:uncharacterized protein (DUF305 family)